MQGTRRTFAKFCTRTQWALLMGPFLIRATGHTLDFIREPHPYGALPSATPEITEFVREVLKEQNVPNPDLVNIKMGYVPSHMVQKTFKQSYVILDPNCPWMAFDQMRVSALKQPMSKELLTSKVILAHEAQHIKHNDSLTQIAAYIGSPILTQALCKLGCSPFKALWNTLFYRHGAAPEYSFFRSFMKLPATPFKIGIANLILMAINRNCVEQRADNTTTLSKEELLAAADCFSNWHARDLSIFRSNSRPLLEKIIANNSNNTANAHEETQKALAFMEPYILRADQLFKTHPSHLDRARKFWERAQRT